MPNPKQSKKLYLIVAMEKGMPKASLPLMCDDAAEGKETFKKKAKGKLDYDNLVAFDMTLNLNSLENIIMKIKALELIEGTQIVKPEEEDELPF